MRDLLIAFFLIVLVTTTLVASFSAIHSGSIVSGMIAVLAVGSVIFFYRVDRNRLRKQIARKAVEDTDRLANLFRITKGTGHFVSFSGSTHLVLASIQASFGALLALWGLWLFFAQVLGPSLAPLQWTPLGLGLFMLLLGAFLVAAGSLTLLYAVPARKKFVLEVSRDGFRTRLGPYVPWELVDEIHMEDWSARLSHSEHRIVFSIPSLPQIIATFGLYYRLTDRMPFRNNRTELVVALIEMPENPQIIYKLIRRCWADKTGQSLQATDVIKDSAA